jgi:hypothetical protein
MTSEDQDILAKISQLAGEFSATVCSQGAKDSELVEGQINRHKNQQEPTSLSSSYQTGASFQTRPSNCRLAVSVSSRSVKANA